MPYLNIPTYKREFEPIPSREWDGSDEEDRYTCPTKWGTMCVWRDAPGKVWWAQCDNPDFESSTWFWTAQQGMHWCEKELEDA